MHDPNEADLVVSLLSAPTVLALTTSLLATSLPRSECRKHIAVFSASTPAGALFSYALLSFVRINSEGNWTGVAMLISVSKASSVIPQPLQLLLTVIGRYLLVRGHRAAAGKSGI